MHTSQTHFGFTNVGSNMLPFQVLAFSFWHFWSWTPCTFSFKKQYPKGLHLTKFKSWPNKVGQNSNTYSPFETGQNSNFYNMKFLAFHIWSKFKLSPLEITQMLIRMNLEGLQIINSTNENFGSLHFDKIEIFTISKRIDKI